MTFDDYDEESDVYRNASRSQGDLGLEPGIKASRGSCGCNGDPQNMPCSQCEARMEVEEGRR